MLFVFETLHPNCITAHPSTQPTSQPSSQPSEEPSMPSGQPIFVSTSQPSRIPSLSPSNAPLYAPSRSPTLSDSDDSSNELSESIIIVLIISVGIIIIVFLILVFIRQTNLDKMKMQMETQVRIRRNNSQLNNEMVNSQNKEPIMLPNSQEIAMTNRKKNENNSNNSNDHLPKVQSIEDSDSYDASVEGLFKDMHININDNETTRAVDENNNDDNYNNDQLLSTEGNDDDGNTFNDGANGKVTGSSNYKGVMMTPVSRKTATSKGNNNSSVHSRGADIIVDETNYKNWSQKEVLIWLKQHLINNNFDKKVTIGFLKEFSRQYVTGKTLLQFKTNDELLNQFKTQFSAKNQAFTIWLIVRTAIQNIGQESQNQTHFD